MYLSVFSRPDIAFSVKELSRHLERPTPNIIEAGKRVLRYLAGTKFYGIAYTGKGNYDSVVKSKDGLLHGFSDADFAGESSTRRSTTGNALYYAGQCIWWKSRSQNEVAVSTTESEYMSLFNLVRECKHIRRLHEFIECASISIPVFCDNKSAICLAKHDLVNNRTKHIDVRYHFIRQEWLKKHVGIQYTGTNTMRADSLTKPVAGNKVRYVGVSPLKLVLGT